MPTHAYTSAPVLISDRSAALALLHNPLVKGMLDRSSEGVIIVDAASGRTIHANRRAKRILTPNELGRSSGGSWHAVSQLDALPDHVELLRLINEGFASGAVDVKWSPRSEDDSPELEGHIMLVRSGAGTPLLAIGFLPQGPSAGSIRREARVRELEEALAEARESLETPPLSEADREAQDRIRALNDREAALMQREAELRLVREQLEHRREELERLAEQNQPAAPLADAEEVEAIRLALLEDVEELEGRQEALQVREDELQQMSLTLDRRGEALDRRAGQLDEREEQLAALETDLQEREAQLDERSESAEEGPSSEEAAEQLRAVEAQSVALDARVQAADERSRALADEEARLTEVQAGLRALEQDTTAARERLREQHQALQGQLEGQREELLRREAELDEREAALDGRGVELEERLAELEATPAQTSQEAFGQQTRQLAELREVLVARQAELEAFQAQLLAEQEALEARRAEPAAAPPESADPELLAERDALRARVAELEAAAADTGPSTGWSEENLNVEAFTTWAIDKALELEAGHHGRAAKRLGIHRATLWRRLQARES